MSPIIYHLTSAGDFERHRAEGIYRPPSLEREGFVHGSGSPEITLAVAHSYYLNAEGEIWVLKLSVEDLKAEVRWEAPAPPGGERQAHHQEGRLFPHIYGEVPVTAIVGMGKLIRKEGGFDWPRSFRALSG